MVSWEKILQHVEKRVNPHAFTSWFRPTEQEEAANGESLIRVRVPSSIHRKRLTETYKGVIEAALFELNVPDAQIEFVCPEAPARLAPGGTSAPATSQGKLDFDSTDHQLNAKYTFETFVVGACNQFAHAASLAVAEQPSKAYNPLFLYGGVGMGKTHLMQAIGHMMKKRNPGMRLCYSSAEKFTNDVINSLRFDRMISFRDRFRTVDTLLVDDIQFIAGKERTQEEFFHTFNALYDQGKQIVISSDCPPKEINSIEERLRSRFEWGLIADIQSPDLETKMAILHKKAESERVALPDEVTEFMARSIKSNIRELEGALTRLIAYTQLTGGVISLPTAQQVLKNLIDAAEKKVTIEQIQRRVSEHFGLRIQDLKMRSNAKAISYPRQIAMYVVKQLTTASLPEIGRQFGGKHHTTVLHSINKIEGLRRQDKDLHRMLAKMIDSFG
jgi:chromosomal replication initiator protein